MDHSRVWTEHLKQYEMGIMTRVGSGASTSRLSRMANKSAIVRKSTKQSIVANLEAGQRGASFLEVERLSLNGTTTSSPPTSPSGTDEAQDFHSGKLGSFVGSEPGKSLGGAAEEFQVDPVENCQTVNRPVTTEEKRWQKPRAHGSHVPTPDCEDPPRTVLGVAQLRSYRMVDEQPVSFLMKHFRESSSACGSLFLANLSLPDDL